MTYDYYRRVLYPFCGDGELRAVNSSLARCSGCGGTMSHVFYDTFLQIRALAEIEGEHAREGAPRNAQPLRQRRDPG